MSFKVIDRGNGVTWIEFNNSRYRNMNEITRWCSEHECGKRVNLRAFSFKNQDEVTMFLLKWQGQK